MPGNEKAPDCFQLQCDRAAWQDSEDEGSSDGDAKTAESSKQWGDLAGRPAQESI